MLSKKILATLTLLLVIIPSVVLAQTALDNISNNLQPVSSVYGQPPILGQDTRGWLIHRVGQVVQVFLGLLGLIMIILVLYGGYLWMTARGNEKQVDDAKHTIRSAIIGAGIIIAAGAITGFVIGNLSAKLLR